MESDKRTNVEQFTGEESDKRHAEQMRRRKASYDARKAATPKRKALSNLCPKGFR